MPWWDWATIGVFMLGSWLVNARLCATHYRHLLHTADTMSRDARYLEQGGDPAAIPLRRNATALFAQAEKVRRWGWPFVRHARRERLKP